MSDPKGARPPSNNFSYSWSPDQRTSTDRILRIIHVILLLKLLLLELVLLIGFCAFLLKYVQHSIGQEKQPPCYQPPTVERVVEDPPTRVLRI